MGREKRKREEKIGDDLRPEKGRCENANQEQVKRKKNGIPIVRFPYRVQVLGIKWKDKLAVTLLGALSVSLSFLALINKSQAAGDERYPVRTTKQNTIPGGIEVVLGDTHLKHEESKQLRDFLHARSYKGEHTLEFTGEGLQAHIRVHCYLGGNGSTYYPEQVKMTPKSEPDPPSPLWNATTTTTTTMTTTTTTTTRNPTAADVQPFSGETKWSAGYGPQEHLLTSFAEPELPPPPLSGGSFTRTGGNPPPSAEEEEMFRTKKVASLPGGLQTIAAAQEPAIPTTSWVQDMAPQGRATRGTYINGIDFTEDNIEANIAESKNSFEESKAKPTTQQYGGAINSGEVDGEPSINVYGYAATESTLIPPTDNAEYNIGSPMWDPLLAQFEVPETEEPFF